MYPTTIEPSDNSHSGNTTLLFIGQNSGTEDPVAQPMGLDDVTRQHVGPSTSDASRITTLTYQVMEDALDSAEQPLANGARETK